MRTRLAKTVYWLSGQCSRIRTWQRYYEMPVGAPLDDLRPAGRHWTSTSLTWKLLALSTRLDPQHFDHWALVHDHCATLPCRDCGGRIDQRSTA